MEAVDNDVLSQISIEEMVPVEQTLSTEPEKLSTSYIKFGNSGFRVRIDTEGKNNFDFTPENKHFNVTENGSKYALMLDASLLELHNLLNNQEKINELGFGDSNLDKMFAVTNKVFTDALEKLFSKSDVKDMATDNNSGVVTIDLKKFKSLGDSDPLVKYLERASRMADGMKVISYEISNK